MGKAPETKGIDVQVTISGHRYSVSDRTRSYLEDEIKKFEKFFTPIVDTHVTIPEEGRRQHVDLVENVRGHTLKSSGEDDRNYSAIDQAANRMVSQLKKLHDKKRTYHDDSRGEMSTGG